MECLDESFITESETEIVNESPLKISTEMEVEVSAEELLKAEGNIQEEITTELPLASEDVNSEAISKENKEKESMKPKDARYRPLILPLSRIKQIIKMDPDVHSASSEAVFLITKATELFIEMLSKDAYAITASSKKKTIQRKDVDLAISNTDALSFLEGAFDF